MITTFIVKYYLDAYELQYYIYYYNISHIHTLPLVGTLYVIDSIIESMIWNLTPYGYSRWVHHLRQLYFSPNERALAIVPERFQCKLGTSHAPLYYVADLCSFPHEVFHPQHYNTNLLA